MTFNWQFCGVLVRHFVECPSIVWVLGEDHWGSTVLITSYQGVCIYASCFSHVWLFATLWTVAYLAPLTMGFSRQEYWSGLQCLSYTFCIDNRSFTTNVTWEAPYQRCVVCVYVCSVVSNTFIHTVNMTYHYWCWLSSPA